MTCEKSAYPSRKAAEEHIRKRLKDNPTLDLRAYLCPKCGLWHMTHKELIATGRYKGMPETRQLQNQRTR